MEQEEKKVYPFVPLRDVVIFPGVTVYLELGREETKNAILHAMQEEKYIITSAQKDPGVEHPGMEEIFPMGMMAEVKQIVKMPDKNVRAVITGVEKVEIAALESRDSCMYARADEMAREEELPYSLEVIAMLRGLKDVFQVYANLYQKFSQKMVAEILEIVDLNRLIYEILSNIPVNYVMKQKVLVMEGVDKRHQELMLILNREIGILRIQEDIALKVKGQVEKNQKEFYLREEIKAIHKELGQEDALSEADGFMERVEKMKAPKKVKKKCREEVSRFRKMSPSSSESAVIRGYVETLLKFPWKKEKKETLDLAFAREVLDRNHYGLDKVKERMIEFLAVKMLKKDGHSPIICLAGPPGTGKTSIAKFVAEALGRKYVRICLGGVRDEAEIRGHRRTYVGAMPGRIVAGMQQAKVRNPLMLLDEIDKLGSDHKGDPASALLEVLDPEQNKHFSDHYMELPVDLSHVMFLCTANATDTIPRPLLDRMEVISLPGYTENEKFHIAKEHLFPKQREENGLLSQNIKVSDIILRNIIRYYVREAGVRNLERKIGSMCRKAAKEIALGEREVVRISQRNEKDYLGNRLERINLANEQAEIGVVRGLAWTAMGGDTLEIQVSAFPGEGKLQLTGKLGEVMQESARIALSYVKSAAAGKEEYLKQHDFHLHVPEGAVPKDGPSAGVTMATALYSVVMGTKVRPEVAVTGELTLRGNVLAIGGLKEKLLAAKAAGIRKVYVPSENKKDVLDLEEEIREGIQVSYARKIEDIWKGIFM